MVKLIWSPRAARDLEETTEYISTDSEYYARIFAQRVVEIAEKIPASPKAGRIVPEYENADLREHIFKTYRIVYRYKKGAVEIVAISHGARLLRL